MSLLDWLVDKKENQKDKDDNKNKIDNNNNFNKIAEHKFNDLYLANVQKIQNIDYNNDLYETKRIEFNKFKIFENRSKETQDKYIKILLYIDQVAQTKPRDEVTNEEKQFFLDFQTMNQSLGIDYQLPPFKESHETQTINTMADVYHHTDALIQNPDAGFQNYIQNSATTNKEISTYKYDKLKNKDFLKLYPKRTDQIQKRQKSNPEWFIDLENTKELDLKKVDQASRPMVEERYSQAIIYGQEFLKNLDQQNQKLQKDYIMSFVLKEFAGLFMTLSKYQWLHFGYDFNLTKIQSTENGLVRIVWDLHGREMGMNYNLATGELWIDDFLYQKSDGANFSIDPDRPRQSSIWWIMSFDDQYNRKPAIDMTDIIQKQTDPTTIEQTCQKRIKQMLADAYKITRHPDIQKQVSASVEKNTIVQDRLHLFVPWWVKGDLGFGWVNTSDEKEFRNMLKIRHNTIEDPDPSYLADVGQAMNRLANFCKKIQIKGNDYNAFIDGSTDTIIKEKIVALSQEMGSLNPIQRGKAFADLIWTTTEGWFVQNGKLQAKDIDNLVTMCEQHQSVDNTDGLEYLKNSIYDTSLDDALTA